MTTRDELYEMGGYWQGVSDAEAGLESQSDDTAYRFGYTDFQLGELLDDDD